MFDNVLSNDFLLLSILVFTAVLMLLEGAYMLWRTNHGQQARHMRRRLDLVAGPREAPAQRQVTKRNVDESLTRLGRALHRTSSAGVLGRMIQQADLKWSAAVLVLGCAATALMGWMVAVSLFRLPLSLSFGCAALTGYLPVGYVHMRRARRMATLERQLPEALDLVTRAVRAGHAFTAALKMAGDEMPDPIGMELRIVNDEVNYGISLAQALTHLTDRVPLTDVRFFVVAVLIQRESGGNLSEILTNLSRLVRDRHKLLARVRVLSAEGRLSGWILGMMPFALAGLMYLLNPTFITPLWTDPIGIAMIQYTLSLMVVGALVVMRIVRIRV